MSALRALARGWRVFVPTIIVDAAVQSLLIVSDPQPTFSWSFCGLVLLSLVVLLAAVWLTGAAASAAVDDVAGQALERAWQRPSILAWTAGIGAVSVGASLLEIWLAPLVLILGVFLLPVAAAGDRAVLPRAWVPIVRAPVRTLLAVVAVIVLALVSWVIALVLGFFVTGVLGAAITWLWLGLVGSYVLCLWCSLYHGSAGLPRAEESAEGPARLPA